jgi:hypothetical protein
MLTSSQQSGNKYANPNVRNSRGSSVGIATGFGLYGRASVHGKGKRFSLLYKFQTGPGVHPASYALGTGGSFPGVKLAGV